MLMNIMAAFAKELEIEVDKIRNFCVGSPVFESDTFEAPIIIDSFPTKDELSKKLRGKHGVYIFFVKDAITLSKQEVKEWNSLSGAKFPPNKELNINGGDCLYVGSCYSKNTSLYRRMKVHYSYDPTATGLQLGDTKREILKDKVKFVVFPINKSFTAPHRKMVLPIIEKRLHETLHPKAGFSRT